jgi:predicted MFS family arabinose efflux permease
MTQVLLCGAAIVTLSMGIRHGFGLWLGPLTTDRGWPRESFAFAIAIQNIAWGIAGPIVGAWADRHGAFRALVAGTLLYAAGLAGMALSSSTAGFFGTAGLLIGIAQAGTTYAVIYGVIARNVDAGKRSWALGITAAAGSFGQFLMVPVEGSLIGTFGWQQALLILSVLSLAIIPLAFGLREKSTPAAGAHAQSIGEALREAFAHKSYLLLTAGYFVCGFQVVFIGVHMPSYLKDQGMSAQVATHALALIGLFNIVGTYVAGALGQRMPKRWILAAIYFTRAVAITVFVLAPLTPTSVYVFSAVMGLLWLSTVPPTNAVIAQMFGVQYMSMLGGVAFLSHQVGSFLGVWLGGRLYDDTGSYMVVWWISVALGLIAAALNLPVREHAVERAKPAAAAA